MTDPLLIQIDDAIKQATEERSHYYMGNILKRVRTELTNYRTLVECLMEDKSKLTDEVVELTKRLEAANIIIENGKDG